MSVSVVASPGVAGAAGLPGTESARSALQTKLTPLQSVVSRDGLVGFEVTLTDPSAAPVVQAAAERVGATVRHVLPQLSLLTLRVGVRDAAAVASLLASRDDVRAVHQVHRWSATGDHLPNDSLWPHQSAYMRSVKAPTAWGVTQGAAGVRIAVVDTGVATSHPDLVGKVVGTYNAITGSTDVTDSADHGTMVAGVAAALSDNSAGIAGAGFKASLLAVKASEDGSFDTDDVAAGITWAADHSAQVINMSFGGPAPSAAVEQAVTYAHGRGAVLVASAGNTGDQDNEVSFPAGFDAVISVGAVDASGHRASFSQHGPDRVDVAAPGVGIEGTTAAGGYASADGTSFAAPIVAGEAALLRALSPGATADSVTQAIQGTATPLSEDDDLGNGLVDFADALTQLPPSTKPTLSGDARTVSGGVPLTVTSSADRVRISVDGTPLAAPVAVSSGKATVTWSSWGSANGTHSWSAADCSAAGCGAPVSGTLTLANKAPVVTAPSQGRVLGASGTFSGTAAGGGLAFYVDGARRGFDGAAPFSQTLTLDGLSEGAHSFAVRSCNSAGDRCNGPSSPSVPFKVHALHPDLTAVSPRTFSPNGDGTKDKTTLTVSLPERQSLKWSVLNEGGTKVRGRVDLGSLGGGDHVFTWNGKDSSGDYVPSGDYRVRVETTKDVDGATLSGVDVTTVHVDRKAPELTSVELGPHTFYPHKDGYRDSYQPTVVLSEPGTLELMVKDSDGKTVRKLADHKEAGRRLISWSGYDSEGHLAAAGDYTFRWKVTDSVGNHRTSSTYSLHLSHKQLVNKTATVTHDGDHGDVSATDSCLDYSYSLSDYSNGVWLENYCDPYGDLAMTVLFDTFHLPAAVQYGSIDLQSYGTSLSDTVVLGGAVTASGDDVVLLDALTIREDEEQWRTYGHLSGRQTVSADGAVRAFIALPNATGQDDYDVRDWRLVAHYKVLQ